jgi:hypothetical protein
MFANITHMGRTRPDPGRLPPLRANAPSVLPVLAESPRELKDKCGKRNRQTQELDPKRQM